MPSLFLLFSHTLTSEQETDIQANWVIARIVTLPDDKQAQWSNVPPEPESITFFLKPIFDWLHQMAQPGDLVLVQGDFGATWLAINFCLSHHLIPVYATTRRQVIQTTRSDGSIHTQRLFKHERFRKYEPYIAT
jgi:hypothetical protein